MKVIQRGGCVNKNDQSNNQSCELCTPCAMKRRDEAHEIGQLSTSAYDMLIQVFCSYLIPCLTDEYHSALCRINRRLFKSVAECGPVAGYGRGESREIPRIQP